MELIRESIKNLVYKALVEHPDLRDDDVELYCYIITKVVPNYHKAVGTEIISKAYHEYGIHYETIRRTRQLLQSKYHDLRGKKYMLRQEQKEIVKQEILSKKNSV